MSSLSNFRSHIAQLPSNLLDMSLKEMQYLLDYGLDNLSLEELHLFYSPTNVAKMELLDNAIGHPYYFQKVAQAMVNKMAERHNIVPPTVTVPQPGVPQQLDRSYADFTTNTICFFPQDIETHWMLPVIAAHEEDHIHQIAHLKISANRNNAEQKEIAGSLQFCAAAKANPYTISNGYSDDKTMRLYADFKPYNHIAITGRHYLLEHAKSNKSSQFRKYGLLLKFEYMTATELEAQKAQAKVLKEMVQNVAKDPNVLMRIRMLRSISAIYLGHINNFEQQEKKINKYISYLQSQGEKICGPINSANRKQTREYVMSSLQELKSAYNDVLKYASQELNTIKQNAKAYLSHPAVKPLNNAFDMIIDIAYGQKRMPEDEIMKSLQTLNQQLNCDFLQCRIAKAPDDVPSQDVKLLYSVYALHTIIDSFSPEIRNEVEQLLEDVAMQVVRNSDPFLLSDNADKSVLNWLCQISTMKGDPLFNKKMEDIQEVMSKKEQIEAHSHTPQTASLQNPVQANDEQEWDVI